MLILTERLAFEEGIAISLAKRMRHYRLRATAIDDFLEAKDNAGEYDADYEAAAAECHACWTDYEALQRMVDRCDVNQVF